MGSHGGVPWWGPMVGPAEACRRKAPRVGGAHIQARSAHRCPWCSRAEQARNPRRLRRAVATPRRPSVSAHSKDGAEAQRSVARETMGRRWLERPRDAPGAAMRMAFCIASWKLRPMAITSPTDFIDEPRPAEATC